MINNAFPYDAPASTDARLETLGGTLALVRHHGVSPLRDAGGRHPRHWLELALAPRPRGLSGSLPQRWERTRQERFGDLVFIPAGEEVRLRSDTGPQHTGIVCEIDPSAFRLWAGGDPQFPTANPGALFNLPGSTIRHLLRRLAEEVRAPGIASARLIEALFVQLAIELARYCREVAEAPRLTGLAGWRLRLIDERLADLANRASLGELAQLCGMSPRQLTRAFRASQGMSLGEYTLQLQLETAKRALAGSETIKKIAFDLGFSSPSRFAGAFRRSFAISPLQFRQRVLQQRSGNG